MIPELVSGYRCLYQGEFLPTRAPDPGAEVKNPREAAAYTHGYNVPLFAQRVHEALTAIRFITVVCRKSFQLSWSLSEQRLHWRGCRAVAGDAVDAAIIDGDGFHCRRERNYRS